MHSPLLDRPCLSCIAQTTTTPRARSGCGRAVHDPPPCIITPGVRMTTEKQSIVGKTFDKRRNSAKISRSRKQCLICLCDCLALLTLAPRGRKVCATPTTAWLRHLSASWDKRDKRPSDAPQVGDVRDEQVQHNICRAERWRSEDVLGKYSSGRQFV